NGVKRNSQRNCHDRAEEEENDELGKAASHEGILRLSYYRAGGYPPNRYGAFAAVTCGSRAC
ncbi:MAG: hypothetical protein IIB99_07055, partial [Planctomycetes bacterium]|nr:hypothetical protein [Planctomycetota bacterium]